MIQFCENRAGRYKVVEFPANIAVKKGMYQNSTLRDLMSSEHVLRANIDGLCVPGVLSAVVQPIVQLSDMSIVGYEALTRVAARPPAAPDWWLERAREMGMRERVEVACWRAILELGSPPDDRLLFMNISPAMLAEPDLLALLDQLPEHVVIEITEQEAVADYERVQKDLEPWLAKNVRLAIDDAGAGHSSLRHVIELLPDFIKIDRSLIQGIDTDRNRRALVHSLVTFAHEVGITVIAEGIETDSELEIIRDAEVALGQGYLLARPERPWPQLALTAPSRDKAGINYKGLAFPDRKVSEEARFRDKLAHADDAKAACEAVVEFLFRRGEIMPSLYLEREGQLRCIAQRGLWQILDGMSESAGITGRSWSRCEPIVVGDVAQSSDYLEAIPGITSEICIPITDDGEAIGALNVESFAPMADDTRALLERCAMFLVERLRIVGWRGVDDPWRRAGLASVKISGLAFEPHTHETAVEILREASGMDSVCFISCVDEKPQLVEAHGPLGPILSSLPEDEMVDLTGLVNDVNSCYSANDSIGHGSIGTESIREFARAIIVLPLRSGGTRIGTVVLAHSRPRALSSDDVEPLELIAGHLAATLDASALVHQLRLEATRDTLTGLANRAAFDKELTRESELPHMLRRAALIIDIDHFKNINNDYGHITGDFALQSLAQHMKSNAPDLEVYRYGGDEFSCLFPYRDKEDAVNIAKRLCEHATSALLPYGSTVTAGMSLPKITESPWETFKHADEALIGAKRNARGEVALHAPLFAHE
jgi:diguanylate cyclase (GGDEF)-like protein